MGCPGLRIEHLSDHEYTRPRNVASRNIPGLKVEREAASAVLKFRVGLVEDGVAAICTKRR